MDLTLLIILSAIGLLLFIAALWWTVGFSFMPDPQLGSIKGKLEKILSICGYTGDVDIRRYSSTYTLNRKIIYIDLGDSDHNESTKNGKIHSEGYLLRKGIHELAHCFNRDSSEHGSMFQSLEERFLQAAQKAGYLLEDINHMNRDCLTLKRSFKDESEEKASQERVKYSLSFNPHII